MTRRASVLSSLRLSQTTAARGERVAWLATALMPIYESDPDHAPDLEFESAKLEHLVVGNRGRMLDVRRTPMRVTAVHPQRGAFEIEIAAFEDAGVRWELALDQVDRFQFARGSTLAPSATVSELARVRAALDRTLTIDCDPVARQAAIRAIKARRSEVARWLEQRELPGTIDLAQYISRRLGDEALFAVVEAFLAERDLAEHDRQFARTFVSNPASGELFKGYAIVLAELGLCPYRGKVVRDPQLFTGAASKERRADFLLARLALMQELWSRWGRETARLYRAAAVEGPWPERTATSFVSATFSREVAESHFAGGPKSDTAVMWRQQVPVTRLLMTFLETPMLNERYREAEAILLGDPDNRAF